MAGSPYRLAMAPECPLDARVCALAREALLGAEVCVEARQETRQGLQLLVLRPTWASRDPDLLRLGLQRVRARLREELPLAEASLRTSALDGEPELLVRAPAAHGAHLRGLARAHLRGRRPYRLLFWAASSLLSAGAGAAALWALKGALEAPASAGVLETAALALRRAAILGGWETELVSREPGGSEADPAQL